MSTKVTIRGRDQTGILPGFHLYNDALDDSDKPDAEAAALVYLRLDGVAVALKTLSRGGASVTVALPRELARELGLLPDSAR